jgi:hypothetical protein
MTTGDSEDAPDAEPAIQPSWGSRWAVLAAAIALGVTLSVAQDWGYGAVFEWLLVFVIGTGFAIAVFWPHRASRWYWPAAVFLVAVHVAALCLHPWHMLSSASGTAVQIKGAAGLDFGASALFLYVLHLLLDPEAGPWTHTTKFVVAAIILFNVGIFGVGALVVAQAYNSKIADLRLVSQRLSAQGMDKLMQCLDPHATENDQWNDPKIGVPAMQRFDGLTGTRITVIDKRILRTVRMETVDGRPLSQDESEQLARCVD